MTEEQQKEIAVFRFGVIHDLVGGVVLAPGEKERLIREKCERKWSIPHSGKTRLTRSTILRWVEAYQKSGGRLESLYPKKRSDRGRSRAIDEETGAALLTLRKKMPASTVGTLIAQLRWAYDIFWGFTRLVVPRNFPFCLKGERIEER